MKRRDDFIYVDVHGFHSRAASTLGEVDFMQAACGLAFDHGRDIGNLELRQVLLDAEMLRNCDEWATGEISRLKAMVKQRDDDLRRLLLAIVDMRRGVVGEPSPSARFEAARSVGPFLGAGDVASVLAGPAREP